MKCKGTIDKNIYIGICLILALIMTFKIYPFIGTADGFSRWNMAIEICQDGYINGDTLLSPIIPYFQALTYKLTNSYGLFTYIQCALFYISVGILTKFCIGERKLKLGNMEVSVWTILSLVILMIPTVYIFPAVLTDSTPVFILIAIMIWFLNKKYHKWIIILVETILILLCVGIRVNSLTVFGLGLIYLIYLMIKKKDKTKIYGMIAISLGCVLGILVPKVIYPNSYNPATLGMVWEMTGIVNDTGNEELKKELSKYGDINEAINRYGRPYLNSIVWDNDPPFPAKEIAGKYSKDITKLYIKTALKNPKDYLKNKLKFMRSALGINQNLISSSIGIHFVDENTMKYGAMESEMQTTTRVKFIEFTDWASCITLKPIVLILFCIILNIILYITQNSQNIKNYTMLLFIGIAYYSGFLLNTQAFEFRYYAPSFYIMLIVLMSQIWIILSTLYKSITKET